MTTTIRTDLRPDRIATVTLARPQVHNAFDDVMVAELTEALRQLGCDRQVRAVVLAAEGKSFSAGADLDWMRRMAAGGREENLADAKALARLLHRLATLPKPTLARVHGSAFGGGVGLVAACDIAIAAEDAAFCLSEVRLGLIPAIVSPYVIAAVGPRLARRWFLTAERVSAETACRAGLVQQVVAADGLDAAVEAVLADLKQGAPLAQAAAKRLVATIAGRPLTKDLGEETATNLADLRAAPEGREGIAAFLEKRRPAWEGGDV